MAARGCALAACVLALAPVWALDQHRQLTQYMHRVWQSLQGLPLASIRAICQTADGYLWLGTESGLYRFDGIRFTPAGDISERLPADLSVTALLEDNRHNLWIGTRSGLLRLSNGVVTHESPVDGLASGSITCLTSDSRGNIWACTAEGPLVVRDGVAELVGSGDEGMRTGLSAACATADGKVWFGGQGPRLRVWNGTQFDSRTIRSLPGAAVVESLLAGREGSVWVGTSDGLVRIQADSEKRYTSENGLPGNSVLSLDEGSDDTLWIGTNAGFSRLRKGELESYTTRAGLSQSTIYAIREDHQGSLWVGTKRGLNQFLDRHTVPITTSEGLPSNDTGPVFQDEAGTLWIGTLGAGLAQMKDHRQKVLTSGDGLASNTIHSLAGGAKGSLWVGTDKGLSLLMRGRWARTLTVRSGLPSNRIDSLYRARSGDLWVGTTRGLAIVRDGQVLRLGGAEDGSPIVSLDGDAEGHIYAAAAGVGVLVFDASSARELAARRIAIRDAVSLYHDGDTLWIGTLGGGLYLADHDRLTQFLPSDGLFDDEIFGITSDARGLLWMACSKGIFAVKRDDLQRFARGAIHHLSCTPYSPLEGVQVVECKPGVQPAVWQMRDGSVAFSTIRGLLLVDPAQSAWRAPAPRAVVEQVAINGHAQTAKLPLVLPPGKANLEFTYSGLDFRAPERVTFRYRLEGFSPRWIDAGARREATFTNLQPGHYRFRLLACNSQAECTEASLSEFVIPARFYQRIWFPPFCAGMAIIGAWLAYRARVRHLRKQFAVILAERTRIARELHDTLLQGFSGVTMQLQALARRLPGDSRKVLDEIIGDSVNCLREVRMLLSNLRNEPARHDTAVTAAGGFISRGEGEASRAKLHPAQGALPAQTEHHLLRIVQEAVTNAMNHSGAGRIRISMADDGEGFTTGSGAHGHYGLVGMKERAAEIGADLVIASQPGEGTTVTLDLPIPKHSGGNGHPVAAVVDANTLREA